MNRPTGVDVVLVGGGPAGATAGAILARLGHDVLILERSTFPRSKPCGESLNPGAVRELGVLGVLGDVLELPHRRVTGWRVHSRSGAAFEGSFPASEMGIALDRAALDGLLLSRARAAGAGVETGVRVADLMRGDGGGIVGVRTAGGREIRSRVVVGADGLRSVVVRRLGLLRRAPRVRKVALTAHVRGAVLPDRTGVLVVRDWGCIGIVEVSAGVANVVVVVDRAAIPSVIADDPVRAFDRIIRTSPYLEDAERISRVQATGPFDWPTRGVIAPGALLVGDAAGYFDPFTGQGIGQALRSGRVAAEVIAASFGGRRSAAPPDLTPYGRWHARGAPPRVRLQRAIEAVVASPRLFDMATALLHRRPSLADRVVGVTGELLPLRGLLFSTGEPPG